MRTILLIGILTYGCSQLRSQNKDEVSVNSALNQAQMSYLRGCVQAFQEMNLAPSFDECSEKAKGHRLELQSIMDGPVIGLDN